VEESALVNDLTLHERPPTALLTVTTAPQRQAESYLIALQQAKLYEM